MAFAKERSTANAEDVEVEVDMQVDEAKEGTRQLPPNGNPELGDQSSVSGRNIGQVIEDLDHCANDDSQQGVMSPSFGRVVNSSDDVMSTGDDNQQEISSPSIEQHIASDNGQNQEQEAKISSSISSQGVTGFERQSFIRRLGIVPICALVFGTLLLLGTASVLLFLWCGSSRNSTWHAIIARDWLANAVTISSEVLKQAINIQIGVSSAMLAAVALERFEVSLPDVASYLMMRNGVGTGKIYSLSWTQWRRRMKLQGISLAIPLLAIAVTCVLSITQAISILLISDIGLGTVAGLPESFSVPFGLNYSPVYFPPDLDAVPEYQAPILYDESSWLRRASFYPAFAEYSEPAETSEGVDDTGLTLRAFLPFSTADTRQKLKTYQGQTTVVDTRVTCQAPNIFNFTFEPLDPNPYGTSFLVFNGSLGSSRATPRLANGTAVVVCFDEPNCEYQYNIPAPFSCLVPTNFAPIVLQNIYNSTGGESGQWLIALCELPDMMAPGQISGGLFSEFSPLSLANDTTQLLESIPVAAIGPSYLVLNVSTATGSVISEMDPNSHPSNYVIKHGQWVDIFFSNSTAYANISQVISTTLCYTAFSSADLPVTIHSNDNRTEPSPVFDFDTSRYTFDAVRRQLGQDTEITAEQRGILQLDPLSPWLANASQLPPNSDVSFLRAFANLGVPLSSGNAGNLTAALWQLGTSSVGTSLITPDVNHALLFQEIVQQGGSIAFALQSLLTVVAGIAYYEQLPQFNTVGVAEQLYFVTANIPQHFRGLLVVLVVLSFHVLLTTGIVILFSKTSLYSTLGNSWQSISQARTAETEGYLDMASTMRDKDLKRLMEKDGMLNMRVGLTEIDGHGKVGVVRYRGNPDVSVSDKEGKGGVIGGGQGSDLEDRVLRKRKTE